MSAFVSMRPRTVLHVEHAQTYHSFDPPVGADTYGEVMDMRRFLNWLGDASLSSKLGGSEDG